MDNYVTVRVYTIFKMQKKKKNDFNIEIVLVI